MLLSSLLLNLRDSLSHALVTEDSLTWHTRVALNAIHLGFWHLSWAVATACLVVSQGLGLAHRSNHFYGQLPFVSNYIFIQKSPILSVTPGWWPVVLPGSILFSPSRSYIVPCTWALPFHHRKTQTSNQGGTWLLEKGVRSCDLLSGRRKLRGAEQLFSNVMGCYPIEKGRFVQKGSEKQA